MSATSTPTDADLILKLYDLRREAEIRKARNWWLGFWPQSAGRNENWNIAACGVRSGNLQPQLRSSFHRSIYCGDT